MREEVAGFTLGNFASRRKYQIPLEFWWKNIGNDSSILLEKIKLLLKNTVAAQEMASSENAIEM